MFTLVALLLAGGCVAGSSSGRPTGPGEPPGTTGPVVIAEPGEIAFRYIESGGIAGDTVLDVIVYGDGHGTVTSFDGEPVPITVPVEDLNDVLIELEAVGVHELDPDEHPEVSVADGFGLGLTVHSINGSSEVGAYGLLEVPGQFGQDWRRVFDAGRRAAFALQERP